jgi:hypothetical protein
MTMYTLYLEIPMVLSYISMWICQLETNGGDGHACDPSQQTNKLT